MIHDAFVISLIILFLHATSWDGHIFEGIKKIIPPEGKLYKPIYGCPICMSPYYGTIMYWLFFGSDFAEWVLTVFCAAGFGVLYVILISFREACVNYNRKFKNNKKQ